MHVKEPRTLIVKEKGLAPVFLDSRLEHPRVDMCKLQIFCIIIIIIINDFTIFKCTPAKLYSMSLFTLF